MPDNVDAPHPQVPSQITCQRVKDAIMDYLNGEMDAEMKPVFERAHSFRPFLRLTPATFLTTFSSVLRRTNQAGTSHRPGTATDQPISTLLSPWPSRVVDPAIRMGKAAT